MSPKGSHISTFPGLGLQWCAITSGYYVCVLGLEPSFSYLHSKHFTELAICTGPGETVFNTFRLLLKSHSDWDLWISVCPQDSVCVALTRSAPYFPYRKQEQWYHSAEAVAKTEWALNVNAVPICTSLSHFRPPLLCFFHPRRSKSKFQFPQPLHHQNVATGHGQDQQHGKAFSSSLGESKREWWM